MDDSFVFISYAHRDSNTVIPIIEALQRKGINVWYDDGIEIGTDWPEFIAGKVVSCAKFVSFVSAAYVASPNCKRELNLAVSRNKDLLSIYIEDITLPLGLEMQLGTTQSTFMSRFPTKEDFANQLCDQHFFDNCRKCTEENLKKQVNSAEVAIAGYLDPYEGKLALGSGHSVVLNEDGSLSAIGDNRSGQCRLGEWKDVVYVAAGDFITAGIREDGSVVYAGGALDNADLSGARSWRNITALWAGLSGIAALNAEGKAFAAGHNGKGQLSVSSWQDMAELAMGYQHTVGLKKDGTVLATGDNSKGQCNVTEWKDIVAIAAAGNHTVGLKKNGTVVATGENLAGECDLSRWENVVAVAACRNQSIGLTADGEVLQAGQNASGKYDLSAWRDVVSLRAGSRPAGAGDLYTYVIAKTADGATLTAGDNDFGQLNIRLIEPDANSR